MNRQEIFDRITEHLLKQNRKAVSVDKYGYSSCRYKTPDGLKCAIGCLIPDGHDAEYSTKSAVNMLHEYKDLAESIGLTFDNSEDSNDNRIFLGKLQSIHDSFEPYEWKECLSILAGSYGLIFNGVESSNV